MAEFIPVDPFELVIFGGTGDLAQRKLLPALFHRYLDGQISDDSAIIGVARSDMNVDDYRSFACDACKRTVDADAWDASNWTAFAKLLDYVAMDATAEDADWAALKARLPAKKDPRVFYLATAPRLYVAICQGLGAAKLVRENARVVLEKPIGKNLDTASEINDGVAAVFPEDSVYRIDHYLGKETVQNLMVLRFANTLLEPIWSRTSIDHVQITVAESLGLEDRADYYDRSGALRDMVQNHILQLLCLTAMEPPNSLESDDVRTEKIKVLRALKPITAETAKTHTVRAQYKSGVIDEAPAKGYLDELSDENATSDTETFVAVKAEIENWRWAGVPFYLRTGKRLEKRHSDIVIQFKPTPHNLFGEAGQTANRLVIRLQPDEGVRLFIQIKEPGPGGLRIKSLPLNLSYAESFMVRYPDAYERLLMDVVRGNLALFMRRDEVEAAWRWVDGLIDAWTTSEQSLETYAAGSNGPLSAAMLLDRDGRAWWERLG